MTSERSSAKSENGLVSEASQPGRTETCSFQKLVNINELIKNMKSVIQAPGFSKPTYDKGWHVISGLLFTMVSDWFIQSS